MSFLEKIRLFSDSLHPIVVDFSSLVVSEHRAYYSKNNGNISEHTTSLKQENEGRYLEAIKHTLQQLYDKVEKNIPSLLPCFNNCEIYCNGRTLTLKGWYPFTKDNIKNIVLS